jgi:hypothetical protein
MVGVYDKLLKKQYIPPQRQPSASQAQQPPESKEPKNNEIQENELSSQPTNQPTNQSTTQQTIQSTSQSTLHPSSVSDEKKEEIRSLKSQSMIFYADQLQILTRHSLQSKMNGKPVSISQMMRDALDDYIHKHNLKK